MTTLQAHGLCVDLGGTRIVSDVALQIGPGQFVGLVGPNGSGKTTLLRSLHRALNLTAGSILIAGDDLWTLEPREAAKRIAVVAQDNVVGFDFKTSEVATMGRLPHQRGFQAEHNEDRRLVAESPDALDLAPLAQRAFNTLSGGERQRALIARALVQQAPILLLDEPTNHLDIHYQLDVLHRVRELGLTTIAALHDLNLAAAWCDGIFVLAGGRIVAAGPPSEALTAERISHVFRMQAAGFTHPVTGKYQLLFDRAPQNSPAGQERRQEYEHP